MVLEEATIRFYCIVNLDCKEDISSPGQAKPLKRDVDLWVRGYK